MVSYQSPLILLEWKVRHFKIPLISKNTGGKELLRGIYSYHLDYYKTKNKGTKAGEKIR